MGRRDGFEANPDVSRIHSAGWQGPVFALAHHREKAHPADGVNVRHSTSGYDDGCGRARR